MKKRTNRLLSLILCCVLLGSTLPQTAFATGQAQDSGITIGTSELCEHHPAHNAECGYTEGTPGTPCNHEHTDECYTAVTNCVHEHTENCYPQGSMLENEATPSDTDKVEPTECAHVCSEESGCITKELNCKHAHDESCGYLPAIEGTPCTYDCTICKPQDSGQMGDTPQTDSDKCICETLCTTDAVNTDCPVCSADGVDLADCEGVEANALSVASVRALDQPVYSANLKSVVKDFEQLCLPYAGDVTILKGSISSIPYYKAWTKSNGNKLLFGRRTFRILSNRGNNTILLDSDNIDCSNYPLLTDPSAAANWGVNNRLPEAGTEFYNGFSNSTEKALIQQTETQEEDYELWQTEFDGGNGGNGHWAGSNGYFFDYARSNIYCFPLSVKEIIQHYGSVEDAKKGDNPPRWTRTQEGDVSKKNIALGGTNGMFYEQAAVATAALSFAMELDTSKIEYVAEPSRMTDDFASTSTASGHEWIAAIKGDNTRIISVFVNGDSGLVQHTPLNSFSDVTALVAMLLDSSGDVVGYGRLTSDPTVSESTLDLSDFDEGNYTLSLYAIKSNGNNQSTIIKAMGSANFTLGSVQPPVHTHTPAIAWTTNSTHHWHICADTDCPNKNDGTVRFDYGQHVDDDSNNLCDTCGESVNGSVQPPVHTHTPAIAWTTNSTHHWHACTAEDCPDRHNATKQNGYGAHSDSDGNKVCDVCGKSLATGGGGSGGGSGGSSGGGSDGSSGGGSDGSSGGNSSHGNSNNTQQPNTSSTPTVLPFTDVHIGDWFYEDVKFVYENKLMSGIGNNLFAPYDATNRAQVAVIFYRMEGNPAVDGKNSFTDVPYEPGTLWFYNAVTWAQKNNTMSGYGDGTFRPEVNITREELAAVFYNYARYKCYDTAALDDLAAFFDAGEISPWARNAMAWATHIKLMKGNGDGMLNPKGTATRSEVSSMLLSFIKCYHLEPPAASVSGDSTGNTGGWKPHVTSP